MNNNFRLMLEAMLDKVKSLVNIKADIKAIETKLPKIKLRGTVDKAQSKKEISDGLKNVNPSVKVKVDADTKQAEKKISSLSSKSSVIKTTVAVDSADREAKSFTEHLTMGVVSANLMHTAFAKITQAIREAVRNAKELDKLKTNIQMASGVGDSKADFMMSGYNQTAKDLSSTTKSVAESANEFIRMGESVKNTNELIRNSQMLSKIGEIEAADSASYLISSMKGYKIEAENSIDIVDKLTSVDMQAAVSAGGLAEALSKCANIASDSGTSMDRLIGYVATAGEVTQKSMSEIGNSFQSIYSRINNIKIGKFIDDETGESLSDTEAILKKFGIQLRDTEDTYRKADDVFDDIGKRWSDFTQVERNAISVAAAGTRQRENFIALMNNYSNALKYAETSAKSSGTALERYAMYQDSVEAKTNELTAALESMSMNTFSESLFGDALESATGLVELIDNTNLLKGSIAGLMTMGISKMFVSVGASILSTAKSTAQLTNAMNLLKTARTGDDFRNIGTACIGLSDAQLKLVLSTKGLTDADRLLILEGKGVADSERQQTLETLGFTTATGTATAATFSFRGALEALKTSIMMNPIGFAIGAITTAVTLGTMAFSTYNQNVEEARQRNMENAESAIDNANSLREMYAEYMNLSQIQNKTTSEEERFKTIVENITKALGDKASALSGLTAGTDEYTEALKNATKAELENQYATAKIGAKAAEDELKDKSFSNLSGSKITIQQNEQMTGIKEHMAALNEVKDILAEFEDETSKGLEWEPAAWDKNKDDMDAVVEYYNALLEARNKLVTSDNADVLMNSDIYKDINTTINELSESVENYTQQKYESLKLEYMWQNGIPVTAEELQKMKEHILDASGAGERFQNIMEGFMTEDFSALSNGIGNLKDQLEDSAETQLSLFDSDSFMEEVSKIQEGYDKILKAKKEFDEYGAITAATLKDLTNDNLIQYLEFTKNGLELNTTALEANEQALKDSATAELYNAMCADIQNLSLGDTGTLSEIAQTAIANLDSAATTAGQNAAIAADGWWQYGASIQSIPGVSDLIGDNKKKAEAIVDQYKKIANSINSISIGKTNSGHKTAKKASGAANKAAKDAEQAAKEASEKAKKYAESYIKYQDQLLSNGKIDYNTYCNSVQNMLDDLYKSGKITADEYFGYIEQKLKKQFDVYKRALSAITKRIQKEADKWQDKIDEIQKKNEELGERKDKYSSALSAIDKVYESEIDKIEEQKNAIQEVIDVLQDENEEYSRNLALQKAAYDFNRAMNQKTKMVYRDGQMVFERDDSAVRDSQDALKDAQHNVEVAELQKKQDDLSLQVENLQKFRDLWSEIANAYQTAQDDMNAKAILGQEYASLVLQNNIADIENFKNQYVAIDQEIQDNTLLIESYEEKVEYYEQLKEKWAEIADVYEDEMDRQCAAMLLGKDWEEAVLTQREGVLEDFKDEYVDLQGQIAQAAEDAAERAVKAAEKAMKALNDTIEAANKAASVSIPSVSSSSKGKSQTSNYKSGINVFLPPMPGQPLIGSKLKGAFQKYGTGTTNAKKGFNWVSERNEDEIFIDNDGNASLITEPTLIPMEGGETVMNPAETKKVLSHGFIQDSEDFHLPEDKIPPLLKNLPSDFKFGNMMEQLSNYNPMSYSKFENPDMSKFVSTVNNDNREVKMEVNINCPNVTNDSGAEYLKREIQKLPTMAMQRNWSVR